MRVLVLVLVHSQSRAQQSRFFSRTDGLHILARISESAGILFPLACFHPWRWNVIGLLETCSRSRPVSRSCPDAGLGLANPNPNLSVGHVGSIITAKFPEFHQL